jgi:hypothetical protein
MDRVSHQNRLDARDCANTDVLARFHLSVTWISPVAECVIALKLSLGAMGAGMAMVSLSSSDQAAHHIGCRV